MKRFYLLSVISLFSAGISAQEITGGERTLSADSIITSDARLDSIYQSLPEVMIIGERPVVKASQGKLVYDLPQLIRDLPVDNAYDAVKELPGVTEMNGGLQLAGQGVTVILNGKVTTLSVEQLYTLLRSIPASRIEKAEVMYNAPARYQVRGALINVQLKQTSDGPYFLAGRTLRTNTIRSIAKVLKSVPAFYITEIILNGFSLLAQTRPYLHYDGQRCYARFGGWLGVPDGNR